MIIDKSTYKSKNFFANIFLQMKWIFLRSSKRVTVIDWRFEKDGTSFDSNYKIPRLKIRDNGDLLCNSCMLCSDICPQKCILIKGDRHKLSRPRKFEIDFKQCTFCMDCVSICPISALDIGTSQLISVVGESSLLLGISKLKVSSEIIKKENKND